MKSNAVAAAGVGAMLVVLSVTCAALTPDACSLLTEAQVSSVLGVPVGPGEHILDSPTMCAWSEPGARNGDGTEKMVVLSGYTQDGARTPVDRFNTAKRPIEGVAKTPVSGIGDEAFYSSAGNLGTALVVRKGDTPFMVEVHGFPVAQVKAKEKTLAGEVIGNL